MTCRCIYLSDAAAAPARLGVDEEALSDDDDLLLGCLLPVEDATDRHRAWMDLNQEYLKDLVCESIG